jgi:RNA polymerase sigma-70 factor (ECF subfamily)
MDGDEQALAQVFDRNRHRLKRMVQVRLDQRLRSRVDPSDVLQEAYVDLSKELPSFAEKRCFSLFLWMRLVVGQRLMRVHRHHLGAEMRDATRDVPLYQGALPHATSALLAAQLLGRQTSASNAAMRAELQQQLQEALDHLDPADREIIMLRNFEELDNKDAAAELRLSTGAASKLFVRAMTRLQAVLGRFPDLLDT